MKFLKLAPDGRSIDQSSNRDYEQHLDSIQHELPAALYRMLRFPVEAYESGMTFYASTLIEWLDVLSTKHWKSAAEISILSPNYDREFLFTLHDPVLTVASAELPVFRLGELYCLEISKSAADNTFSFCFLSMHRTEVRVDCGSFSFSERPSRYQAH